MATVASADEGRSSFAISGSRTCVTAADQHRVGRRPGNGDTAILSHGHGGDSAEFQTALSGDHSIIDAGDFIP